MSCTEKPRRLPPSVAVRRTDSVEISFPRLLRFLIAAVLVLPSSLAQAADRYWNASSGNWSTPAYWGGTEPTSADTAYINNGGTATITQSGEVCKYILLGYTPSDSGTVQMDSGDLSEAYAYIGYTGIGTFTQSAGNNTVANILYLGNNSGSYGSYNLNGGWVNSSSTVIGGYGTGTFTQNTGTHTISTILILGLLAGSNATYNLNDGQLNALNTVVGSSGTGYFIHSLGNHTLTDSLFIGGGIGSYGMYYLYGTGQLSAVNETIGSSGTGSFIHMSGTNTLSGSLYLGYNSSCTGASYYLSGTGQLSAINEYIGYSAAALLQQNGGMNNATDISIGQAGVYQFIGGSLQVSGGLVNQGSLDFNGFGAGDLQISGCLDNQGTIDFGGSPIVMNVSNAIVNFARTGSALTNSQAATLNIGTNSLLIIPPGFNPANAFQHFNNSGIVHTLGTPLTIPGGQAVLGWGNISDFVDCSGTIAAGTGRSLNLSGGLTVSGNVNIGNGDLTIDSTNSGISGGSLSIGGNQYVGNTGNGAFTHSAGTNTVAKSLYLGNNSGAFWNM